MPNWKMWWERFEGALLSVVRLNEESDTRLALRAMQMYGQNVVDHPSVPRYRRITKSNVKYKQSLQKVVGHDQLLMAMGFESLKEKVWEWQQPEEEAWRLVLSIMMLVLKELLSGENWNVDEMPRVVQRHLTTLQEHPQAQTVLMGASAVSSGPTPPQPELSSLLDKLQQDHPTTSSSSGKDSNDTTRFQTPLGTAEMESWKMPTSVAIGQERISLEPPTSPQLSVGQVSERLHNGETLPDIQTVPSGVTSHAPLTDVSMAPLKPWENSSSSSTDN